MQLKPYEDKYKNQVIALILYLQNYDNKVDLSLEQQPDMNAIPRYYFETGGNFWIVVNDEDLVVGTIGFLVKGKTGVLKKFFVHPDYRGRDKGVSTPLYDKLIETAKEKELDAIVLDTPANCHAAHRFYEKKGFVRIEKDDLPVQYDYPDRDSLLFLLEL